MASSGATINEVRDSLKMMYETRYNDIKKRVELRSIENPEKGFMPITDYLVNSIWLELYDQGVQTSISKLENIFKSTFSEIVNPIRQYFDNLPAFSPTNRAEQGASPIARLASTVRVAGSVLETEKAANDRFIEYLRKWLTASVANQYKEAFNTNHNMIVFKGAQGAFKTTWLENLCPPELSEQYLFSGTLNPKDKDSLTLLATTFLYNIDDQLTSITKKDYSVIKDTITKNSVMVRTPFARHIEQRPRITNFVASVNDARFLYDPSGSRRFLAFSVLDIDIKAAKKINMKEVYAEAKYYYELSEKGEFRYYFDSEEVARINEINEEFRDESVEEQMISSLYVLLEDHKQLPAEDQSKYMFVEHQQKDIKREIEIQQGQGFKCGQKNLSDAIEKRGFSSAFKKGRIKGNAYPVSHYKLMLKKPEFR